MNKQLISLLIALTVISNLDARKPIPTNTVPSTPAGVAPGIALNGTSMNGQQGINPYNRDAVRYGGGLIPERRDFLRNQPIGNSNRDFVRYAPREEAPGTMINQ